MVHPKEGTAILLLNDDGNLKLIALKREGKRVSVSQLAVKEGLIGNDGVVPALIFKKAK